MSIEQELQATIRDLVQPKKGILAADESIPTITKRFRAVGIEPNEENRRAYRELLVGTPGAGDFLSGVIFFEETLGQKASDGTPLPELCVRQGIVPGIKVDKGLAVLPNTPDDKITQGLDFLADRLPSYKAQGARFAKWRDVYFISATTPSKLAIKANAEVLARYAAVCQSAGIVPIVEPEVLIDGDHTLEQCEAVTEHVLHAVFHALHRHRVRLELMVLKPNMVLPGKEHAQKASPEQVAERTIKVFRRTVPAAVPSINFLSGGQSPEEATANLDAMNRLANLPWNLSFSYARALQEPVMSIWRGDAANLEAARQAFAKRGRLNSAATQGQYEPSMESGG